MTTSRAKRRWTTTGIPVLLGVVLAMPAGAGVLGDNGLDTESLFDLPIGDLMEIDVLPTDNPPAWQEPRGEDPDPSCDPPRPDCEPLELWPEDLPDPGAGPGTA